MVLTGVGLLSGFFLGPVIGLGISCLGMPLFSLCLERKALDRLLVPPFTIHVFWGALGCGLGVPMLSLLDPPEWKDSYLKIQLVFLACLPVGWACYNLGGWRKVSAAALPQAEKSGGAGLTVLAWSWFLASCFLQLTRSSLGLDNRGAGNPSMQLGWDPFGLTFFLGIFPRLEFLGYFFVPFLWGVSKRTGKIILLLLLGLVLARSLLTGARGLVLYPTCFILLGAYFFRSRDTARFEKTALAIILGSLGVVVAILVYRTSPFYLPGNSGRPKPALADFRLVSQEQIRLSGYSFHGVEDVKVYELFPKKIPLAGWENFRAILFTWVPSYFVRKKPVLLDGDRVAGSVQEPRLEKLSGHGISMAADSYRRFGWWGIFPTVAVAFFLYGCLVRWLLNRPRPGSLFSWGTLALAVGFFQGQPFGGSLLSTWHLFFYSLLKHLAVLWLGCLFLEWICRARSQAGGTGR